MHHGTNRDNVTPKGRGRPVQGAPHTSGTWTPMAWASDSSVRVKGRVTAKAGIPMGLASTQAVSSRSASKAFKKTENSQSVSLIARSHA